MNSQNVSTEESCPRSAIAAYLDGELTPQEEMSLEMHLAVCDICRAQLNEEKKLLCALDFALEEKTEIEIPKDFAKVVAARAESNVNGLRDRSERPKALFLCASLFLFAMVGLGAETEQIATAFFSLSEKIFAVISFSAHLIFDITFGTIVILRSLSHQVVLNPIVLIAVVITVFIISAIFLPRIFTRFNRS